MLSHLNCYSKEIKKQLFSISFNAEVRRSAFKSNIYFENNMTLFTSLKLLWTNSAKSAQNQASISLEKFI